MADKFHYTDFHHEMSKSEFTALIKKLGRNGYRIVNVESKRADFGHDRAYHFVLESSSKIDEAALKNLVGGVIDRNDW